jgi:hypothetical protein
MADIKINTVLRDSEIRFHIEKLISFLGKSELERSLKTYTKGKLSNKNRPIYNHLYFMRRHPWFETLIDVKKLTERRGQYEAPELENRLWDLARDSKQIFAVFKHTTISDRLKNKFRRDLLDPDNARSYLFELKVAFMHLLEGGKIEWLESKDPNPEFIVKRGDYSFQVECKFVSYDKGLNCHQRDFYTIADWVLPTISQANLAGEIEITLNGKLPSNSNELKTISEAISEAAYSKQDMLKLPSSLGEARLILKPRSGILLDQMSYMDDLMERKPGAIYAVRSPSPEFQDPVALTLTSSRFKKMFFKAVLETMKDARTQFSSGLPGVLTLCLEGFSKDDLLQENNKKNFDLISSHFSGLENSKNIAGVCYVTQGYSEPRFYGSEFTMLCREYINLHCPKKPPEGFRFLVSNLDELYPVQGVRLRFD